MNIVEIEIRSNYGTQAIYPVNREAKLFSELLAQKTLTLRDIGMIKKLGFHVENVAPVVIL